MGFSLGFAVEALVAVLLAVTIGYCVLVNRKLVQLRSDQSELKAIVHELHAATHQAEQAIAGLRDCAQVADETLGHQIERVRTLDEQLRVNIGKGESLLSKLSAMPRVQQARTATSRAGREEQQVRQSAVGLGMLNAQRRKQAEAAGGTGKQDDVAA